jgi:Na+/H+ antiporter NhaD/arsenite permease-like protein
MSPLLILVFVLAYLAIALAHPLKVNKSASALIGAGVLWTAYALFAADPHRVGEGLNESQVSTAQIVFFLMGTMTIVEVVDAHDGFEVITVRIHTTRLPALMWVLGLVAFFLSAILDNLTTSVLWIGGQITALEIVKDLLLPSLVNVVLPLSVVSFMLRGRAVGGGRPATPQDR